MFELARPYFLHDIDKHSIFVYNVTNLINKVKQMENNNSFMYQSDGTNTKQKFSTIFKFVLMALACILFLWMFVSCIFGYGDYNKMQVDDLMQEQLTFQRYEYVGSRKSKRYEIYFTEYEKPFVVDSIADSKMDRDALKSLTPNTVVTVYYDNTSRRDYDYEICHLTTENLSVLTFDDYINANKSNQIVGMVVSPIMVGAAICLIVIFKKFSNDIDEPLTEQDKRMMKYLDYTIENKKQVLASQTCRCANCLATFSGAEVTEFTDKGKTAICPKCGEDTVLPDCVEGLDDQLLQEIHDYWFEDDDDTADDLSE